MANLPESSSFDAGVYQLETTDPVQGGATGVTNTPLKNLVNRTRWLYDQITSILTTIAGLATLNSPTLTGTPRAPTPAPGDNSTTVATTAFVDNALYGVASVNVAGGANVTLTAAQYGDGVIVLTGAITANINVIFPVNGTWVVINSTTGAFSVTCKTAAGSGIAVTQGKARTLTGDGTNTVDSRTDFQSVVLTGTPTAPTPGTGDNSTTIATTAYVKNQAYLTGITSSQVTTALGFTPYNATNPSAYITSAALAPYAPLASPALTGTPTAPTAGASNNSQTIANTNWLWANIQALVTNCIAAVSTAMGFVLSGVTEGYMKFPSYLGGFMVQWGHDTAGAGSVISFPAGFPNTGLAVIGAPASTSSSTISINIGAIRAGSFDAYATQASAYTTCGFWWIAVGY